MTTCFLLDVETGKQLEATTDRPTIGLESILDSHTLVCETAGHVDSFIFKVPGQALYEDTEMPWSMAGRDPSTGVFAEASHLLDAGKKTITVVGTYQGKECFSHHIDIEVSDGMEGPDARRRLMAAANSDVIVDNEQEHRRLGCPCIVVILIALLL